MAVTALARQHRCLDPHGRRIGAHSSLQQAPNLCDPVTPDVVGEEACVADAMESRWQDVDQEAANQPGGGKANDVLALSEI